MVTFEIATPDDQLPVKRVTPNNVEKHRADFCVLLGQGVTLASVTATVTAGSSTTTGAALSSDRKSATWFIHAAALAEACTVLLTVTTNDGQTLLFTINYQVRS